jgi:hypothetical protein
MAETSSAIDGQFAHVKPGRADSGPGSKLFPVRPRLRNGQSVLP